MSNSNHQESGDDGGNGFNLGPDILEALLRASQSTADAEDVDSLEGISGEYSSINKTIDELNGFLDRWEERHNRLRNEIHEVLTEQEQSQDEGSSSTVEGSNGEGACNLSTEQLENCDSIVSGAISSDNSGSDSISDMEKKDNSHCGSQASFVCESNENKDGNRLQSDDIGETENEPS